MERIEISSALLEFAKEESSLLVPKRRTQGFEDQKTRGYGDLLDHVGTLAIFKYFANNGSWVKREITAGPGDNWDLSLFIAGLWRTVNVKTSSYPKIRPGLNLMVKAEELDKPIDIYLQAFVHLESKLPPHLHLCGYAKYDEISMAEIQILPNTNGHRGVMIKVEDLKPIERLVEASAL